MRTIKSWASITALIVAFGFLAACANHPLNMSTAEWEALTPSQQHEARLAQAAQDTAAQERRATQAAAEIAEQERQEALRRNAPYGGVVQCTISDAQASFGNNKWRAAQDVGVELHSSEADRDVRLTRQDKSGAAYLQMGFDGLNVKVCSSYSRDCDVLAGTESQFRRGLSKRIAIKKTVEGKLTCSFPRRW